MNVKLASLMAAVLLAAGCASSPGRGHGTAPAQCATASLDTLAQIGQALTTPKGRGLYDGEQVHLGTPVDGYTDLVAARVNTGTDQPVGVWALGGAYIDAVDAVAQRYTDWGAGTAAGSQGAADRRSILASAAYRTVKACVPAQP